MTPRARRSPVWRPRRQAATETRAVLEAELSEVGADRMSTTPLFHKRITQRELESYLWGAAVLLRGLIDAGDYKQFIFPLVFLKRLSDVYDEEHAAALDDLRRRGARRPAGEPPLRYPRRRALGRRPRG